MMVQPDGHLIGWMRGGEVPDMAQPPKKRPFVPGEQDRRRASEFRRKAEEIGQPALAKIVGVSVRTLQRYMDLGPGGRAMPAYVVDRYEHQFGQIESRSIETPAQPQNGKDGIDDAVLESVLARHERELSYAQVKDVRKLQGSGLQLSEAQWEHVVSAILSGRQPSP